MELHICAIKYFKSYFRLCEQTKRMVLVGATKYYLWNTYAYFGNFWVLESNGIHP